MDLPSILLAVVIFLGATAICVTLFTRLGFGSVLGFIVSGIIIGPHTPGPVPFQDLDELQSVAQIGVVLFMFTVGLEMRPEKVWSMRRLLFGLGSAQMLITAAALAVYLFLVVVDSWGSAIILGLGFAMSSTAIVMATLEERGELSTEHGQTSFAILMAQDFWIVPVMALIPILAHITAQSTAAPLWEKLSMVAGVIAAIVIVGRYLLPVVLGYCAKQRRMDTFGIVLFLAVIAATWAVDRVGVSMTLGAFLMGMLLSASDHRYQIEATVAPFKETLMGLFFIAVGMSIDVGALASDWPSLIVQVPVVLTINTAVLILLALAFGIGRSAAIRTGFYLSQVGEFAFVLLGAASIAGLLDVDELTLAMLLVSTSMILTPLMVRAGDYLARRLQPGSLGKEAGPAADLDRHVVVIGYGEVGRLICLMLERAGIPYAAFTRDIDSLRQAGLAGHNVYFGDMYSSATQQAAGLGKAAAACVTSSDATAAKALAMTLHSLYPHLNVYVGVRTLEDQDELVARGIRHASIGDVESTLLRGSSLLRDIGVPEDDVRELVESFRDENYALIRASSASQ